MADKSLRKAVSGVLQGWLADPTAHPLDGADAVLAVFAEHVGGDAIEAAVRHIMGNRRDVHLQLASCRSTVVTDFQVEAVLKAALPIIAASARAKALEEAAQKIGPDGPRPCDCERCDCMNVGDAEAVAAWDERAANAAAIRALAGSDGR